MDDLQNLATLLAKPEQPRDGVDEARQRLQNAMRGGPRPPVRKRRTTWLAGGLGLTATAAAAAVAISLSATAPDSSPVAVPMSARQVLLSAADTAERVPDTGTYWYVKEVSVDGLGTGPVTTETWTKRDGQVWLRGLKTEGTVMKMSRAVRWSLGGPAVSYKQLQHLPAEPEALKAWITGNIERSDLRTSAGRPDATMRKALVFTGLFSLICTLPTTSKIRAAAFRAIASYPDVQNLGKTEGGQELRFHTISGDNAEVVINPATSRVYKTNYLIPPGGGEQLASDPGAFILTTEWTNDLPQ